MSTRKLARAAGHTKYEGAKACKYGHGPLKDTKRAYCVVCRREYMRNYMRNYRKTDKYKKYQRAYHEVRRLING